MARTPLAVSLVALALGAIACSNPSTPAGDAGNGGTDTGGGGNDTGVPPTDTGVPPTDTGVPPTDTGVPPTDTGGASDDAGSDVGPTTFPDGGIMCLPGVECLGWDAAITAASRGAAGDSVDAARANCVVQMHQTDCCGAMRAYGVNHGSRTDLCNAEDACQMMYPSGASCSSDLITTDTGETTTDASLVRVRAVRPMSCSFGTCYDCETFLCMDSTCMGFGGVSSTQCGP
jgi:hypothetical protein